MKLPIQYRALSGTGPVDVKSRTARFSFSSEFPVKRQFGIEVLSHDDGAMVDDRLKARAVPFLADHDWNQMVGKVVDYGVEGRSAWATVKFGRSSKAEEIMQEMADEVRTEISVGYVARKMEKIEDSEDGPKYLVTKWEPMEVSSVSVPADYSVGAGRGYSNIATREFDVEVKDDGNEPDPWEKEHESNLAELGLPSDSEPDVDDFMDGDDECAYDEDNDDERKEGKYGNVPYADEKNKKYPIDAKHVKAAWSYINMPKNAKKYSPERLKAIKAKIKAAMKKHGHTVSEKSEDAVVEIREVVNTEVANATEPAAPIAPRRKKQIVII